MIDATFVQKIVDLVNAEALTKEVDGKTYTTRELKLVRPPKDPLADALGIATLLGLADYVAANRDKLTLEDHVVQVVDPEQVRILSALRGLHRQREVLLVASVPREEDFAFGRFHDTESMIIALQSRFTSTGDRDAVLALVANVKNEEVRSEVDSGVTQVVETRKGVALVASTAVPAIVSLAPFRTFSEVDQPASPFLLRCRTGDHTTGNRPSWAIFEADGGAWKLEAIKRVRDFLRAKLPEGLAILA